MATRAVVLILCYLTLNSNYLLQLFLQCGDHRSIFKLETNFKCYYFEFHLFETLFKHLSCGSFKLIMVYIFGEELFEAVS